MENEKLIDQSELAQSVADKISYDFLDYFLVKPLDPVKVKKTISKPVSNGEVKKDEAGIEAEDFDKVETEIVEVDSDYRKGVVIKVPNSYKKQLGDPEQAKWINANIKPGDVIIFKDTAGLRFDLVKDSRLIKLYEIIGIEK